MLVSALSVAEFAGLLANPGRSAMCLALLDGCERSAGELARHAGLAPSTASEHLALLVDGGLLVASRRGRHRYLRIASPQAARLIEDVVAVVGRAEQPRSLRGVRAGKALQAGRTCYDHLAGRLGVGVCNALQHTGHLRLHDDVLALTDGGRAWLAGFGDVAGGVDGLTSRPASARPLVRTCLDWTERRPHLGGLAGALVCEQFLTRGWVVRDARSRAVSLTDLGRAEATREFGHRITQPA